MENVHVFFDPETAKGWVEKVDDADVGQWMKQAMEKKYELTGSALWGPGPWALC